MLDNVVRSSFIMIKFMCITNARLGGEIKYYHDKVYVYYPCQNRL